MGIVVFEALAFNRILIALECVSFMHDIDYSIKAILFKTTKSYIQSFKPLHLCTLHYHLWFKRRNKTFYCLCSYLKSGKKNLPLFNETKRKWKLLLLLSAHKIFDIFSWTIFFFFLRSLYRCFKSIFLLNWNAT